MGALARRFWRLACLLALFSFAGCLGVPDPFPLRPDARAGIDQLGHVGEPVELDASASTTSRTDALTYAWSFDETPEGSLLSDDDLSPNGSAEAVSARFTPDQGGRYVIRLAVSDDQAESLGDFVVIDVDGAPPAPIAAAGPDQTVKQGMAVYLNGSGSHDPDGKTLYYRWTLAGTPGLSQRTTADLVNPYTPYPSLIVDTGGVFTLSLVVTDGDAESAPDYVFISVEDNNAPPVADAGGNRTIEACTQVDLDASSSYDLDRDALAYRWSVLISPLYSAVTTTSLDGPTAEESHFYADRVGDYVVQLEVSDGQASSVPDVVRLTAVQRSHNQAPVPMTGGTQTLSDSVVCTGAYCPDCPAVTVSLSGVGTVDPDGDPMSYAWSVTDVSPEGSQGTADLQTADRITASVDLRGAAASLDGPITTVYQLRLTATDCPGDSGAADLELRYTCTGGN